MEQPLLAGRSGFAQEGCQVGCCSRSMAAGQSGIAWGCCVSAFPLISSCCLTHPCGVCPSTVSLHVSPMSPTSPL